MNYLSAIILSVFLLQVSAGANPKTVHRFLGYDTSTPYSAPYMAIIFKDRSTKDRCGGALISEEFVLTAAQCVHQYKIEVFLGLHNINQYEYTQQHRNIPEKNIIVHPNYDGTANDIALIRLPEKVKSTEFIKPIKMAEKDAELFVGETAGFYGWGSNLILPDTLQHTKAEIIGNNKCSWYYLFSNLDKSVMCAKNNVIGTSVAACWGDSGGPLIIKKDNSELLVGIAAVRSIKCLLVPTIFTRVSEYRNWIDEVIGGSTVGTPSPYLLTTLPPTRSADTDIIAETTTLPPTEEDE